MNTADAIVKNAVACGICQAPADRYNNRFQCQDNSNHVGDLNVGIFTDRTWKDEPSAAQVQPSADTTTDEVNP
jgi:hypothetical protein